MSKQLTRPATVSLKTTVNNLELTGYISSSFRNSRQMDVRFIWQYYSPSNPHLQECWQKLNKPQLHY